MKFSFRSYRRILSRSEKHLIWFLIYLLVIYIVWFYLIMSPWDPNSSVLAIFLTAFVSLILVFSHVVGYLYFRKKGTNIRNLMGSLMEKNLEKKLPNVMPEVQKMPSKPSFSYKELPVGQALPKKKEERKDSYREIARLLQVKNNSTFTKSMLLGALEKSFGTAVSEDRKKYLDEINDWLNEDNYASVARTEDVVNHYRII